MLEQMGAQKVEEESEDEEDEEEMNYSAKAFSLYTVLLGPDEMHNSKQIKVSKA